MDFLNNGDPLLMLFMISLNNNVVLCPGRKFVPSFDVNKTKGGELKNVNDIEYI